MLHYSARFMFEIKNTYTDLAPTIKNTQHEINKSNHSIPRRRGVEWLKLWTAHAQTCTASVTSKKDGVTGDKKCCA